MSRYFREEDIKNIITTLNDVEKYEPLTNFMSSPENMGQVLDDLIDNLITEIVDDPADTLYRTYSTGGVADRFTRAEKDLRYRLA